MKELKYNFKNDFADFNVPGVNLSMLDAIAKSIAELINKLNNAEYYKEVGNYIKEHSKSVRIDCLAFIDDEKGEEAGRITCIDEETMPFDMSKLAEVILDASNAARRQISDEFKKLISLMSDFLADNEEISKDFARELNRRISLLSKKKTIDFHEKES